MKNLLTLLAVTAASAAIAQVSFTNQTSLLPSGAFSSYHPIVVGDMDGDKKDDIAILHNGEEPVIQYQNGSGGFTEYVYPNSITTNNAWGACLGDVDGNGFSDLLYGGSYDDLHLMTSTGAASSYTHSDLGHSLFLQGVNFADIDNDGNLDIFACHDDGPSLILLGDGLGGFTASSAEIDTDLPNGSDNSGNYGSTFIDIDNDCDMDLYVAKCRQGVSNPNDFRRINLLFINDGNGNYTEDAASWGINSGEQSWSADFADIDNDGDLDLFIGQHSTHSQIFVNNGNGTFTDITATSGIDGELQNAYVIQSVFEDFDNDGWIDLLVSGANNIYYFQNDGDGTFTPTTMEGVHLPMNSFALGDLNSDGFTDIYATPHGYGSWGGSGEDSLYFNNGNSNTHLTVSLVGTTSNSEGIGARVTAYGGGIAQIREIRSGASYGISNSLNAHFGCGTTAMLDSVVVCWPSGTMDVLTDVSTNQFVTIVEGQGVGVNENILPRFSMYPNPADNVITLDLSSLHASSIEIFDATGRMVKSIPIQKGNQSVDVSDLSTGQYVVTVVTTDGVRVSERLIIQ